MFALENHPAVQGAELGVEGAKEGKNVERSNYYPELSLSVTAGRVFQDNATSRGLSVTRGAAYSGLGEGNLALRQMLFDGHETDNRVQAAEARIESSSFDVLDVEQAISLKVAQSYVDVTRIRSALNLLALRIADIKDYEQRIDNMVSEGVADEAELQQARDVSMIMDGLRADYEGQLASAEAAYWEAVGKEFPEVAIEPDSLKSYIYDDMEKAVTLAQENNPMLKAAQFDALASEYDVDAQKAQILPDVSGELSYLKSDKRDVIGGEILDKRAVLRMNWNFSTGGRQMAQVRQKDFAHKEAQLNLETLSREIERDIHQAYASYRTLSRKMVLAKERIDLNEKLLSAYKTQFEGARISLLSLMRAESQLFNARLAASDNQYSLLVAEYNILASMGELKNVLMSQASAIEPAAGDPVTTDETSEN